ncbi:MAG TPA: hypothetical protein P5092_11610 [Ruminococcus sp.]|nr:hypothetical protein [Ruminococcus sp.]HRU98062.1 hypothetical protein [Ruminococcus sp.]
MTKEELLKELDRMRDKMIRSINSDYDNLRMKLTGEENVPAPIHLDNPSRFIGTKPVKLYIGSEEYSVSKWSEVAYFILCKLNSERYNEIRGIADKLSGKKRTILGSSGDGMDRALKVDEDLYFEAHFGTEMMLTLLLKICKYVDFDGNTVLVSVINR